MQHLFPRTGIIESESPYYPVGPECLIYLDFGDGLESALDHSIYGNDATLFGPAFGPLGLTFDDIDDYLTHPLVDIGTGAATVVLWIYFNSDATRRYPTYNLATNGYFFNIVWPGDWYFGWSGGFLRFVKTITPDNWYCLILTRSADSNAMLSVNLVDAAGSPTQTLSRYLSRMGAGHPTYPLNGIIGQFLALTTEWHLPKRTDYFNFTKGRYSL
jgi:hypothetical protein